MNSIAQVEPKSTTEFSADGALLASVPALKPPPQASESPVFARARAASVVLPQADTMEEATATPSAATGQPEEATQASAIEELKTIDPKQRRSWLIDHVGDFAHLPDVQVAKLLITLNETYNLPNDWLKREWKPLLKKQPKPSSEQAIEINESDKIRNDLKKILGGDLSLNECTQSIYAGDIEVNDGVMAGIRVQMRDKGWKATNAIEDVIFMDAYANSFNPIKSYLEGLEWDGFDHIKALADHIVDKHPVIVYTDGSTRTTFHAWLIKWLIGAISKLYTAHTQNPVLVMDGGQGIGKSEVPYWLSSPFRDFYTEKSLNPDDKELERMLASTFIWEIAEFGATTRRADREALKSILTRHYSTFRVPYTRSLVKRPIMASFFGTINEEGGGFLTDPTGNRRFLVVNIERIDWEYKQKVNIDQLWAQVFALYRSGECGTLTPEEVKRRDEINQKYETGSAINDLLATRFNYDHTQEHNHDWQMTATDMIAKLQADGFRFDMKTTPTAIGIYMKRRGIRRTDNHPRYYCGVRYDFDGTQPDRAKVASTQPLR